MTTLSLMPYIISREFNNDGKISSGAKIYTYHSGTNTPKSTFKTADGSVLNTNPIIADASGSFTCFLGAGAYRIKITDQNDVDIMPALDGVIGAGSGGITTDSTASATLLQTYNELRALTTTPDLVYVSGRATEGDGGQGFFQYIPGSSEVDDGSIVLTAQSGSKIYKRIFDGFIDPTWSGLKYTVAIDQTTALNQSTQLSIKYGLPVYIQGPIFINTNITIPTNSSLNIADNGYFFASSSKTVSFEDDSKLTATDNSFGTFIQPIFGKRVVSEILLSWMNGSVDDDRMDKLLLSTTDKNAIVVIDKSVSILASTWVFPNITRYKNSSIITFTGASALSITAKYIEALPTQIFSTTSTSYSFDFGTNYAYAEWFAGVGDGIVDDSSAFKYAANSGKVELLSGKTYKINQNISFTSLDIKGSGILDIGNYTFSGSTFTVVDSTILTTSAHSNEGLWRTITGSTTAGQLTFTSGYPYNVSIGAKFILSASNETWTSVSASNGNNIYTGKDWNSLGSNYYAGKKIQCVSNLDYSPWITVSTFIGINATFDSGVSATTKDMTGCLYTNLNSLPTFEEPYLRKAKLPLIINATSLATDRNGMIFDIGKTITFTSGVDYTLTSNGSGWSTGIGFTRVTITPFTTHTAILNVALQFNLGGVPPQSDTVTYADIDIVAINDTLKYWINNQGSGLMGSVDYCERYDNYANYTCNIPGAVYRAGYKTWVFCGPKGINGAFTGSLFTPNPWMGWRDIWPAVTYTNPSQIRHGIGFSQIITIPNAQ